MSLRVRLFLVFGALLALLVGAEWWLARTLSRELGAGVDRLAFDVGWQVAEGFGAADRDAAVEPQEFVRRFAWKEAPGGSGPRVMVVETTATAATGPDAGEPRPDPPDPPGETTVFVQRWSSESTVVATGTAAVPPMAVVPPAPPIPPGDFELKLARAGGERVIRLEGPNFRRVVRVPEAGIDAALDRFLERMLLGSAAILALGLLAAAMAAHRVASPLSGLAGAAQAVEGGALGTTAPVDGSREVREAIGAFNRMSTRLAELDREAAALRERRHLSELGEVARGLAHSLRNPLNALGLAIEELAARGDDPRGGEVAAGARGQIRAADGAIRSFLALASGDGAEPSPVDLRALAEDVVLEAIQSARGRVRVELLPGRAVTLVGVAPELRAALQALVVNAVEASPEGGAVRVAVVAREGGAEVFVEDEGEGIPDEVRGRLFEPHVTTKPNGSGMGLFLARRLATGRYGGDVAVARREPRGTRAVLTLRDREAGRG